MFLSTKVLSKLMKDAYKVRLKVGHINDGITIIGGHWAVWLEAKNVPNKIKALIMELAGELPQPDKLFAVCKDNPVIQYEIITEDIKNLFDGVEDAENKLNMTPIVLDAWKATRVLQAANTIRNIVEIDDTFIELIDKSEINLDIEGEPTGPCYATDPYGPIFWYNDICKLMVIPMKPRINHLFDALREVDLYEKILAEE